MSESPSLPCSCPSARPRLRHRKTRPGDAWGNGGFSVTLDVQPNREMVWLSPALGPRGLEEVSTWPARKLKIPRSGSKRQPPP